MTGSIDGLLKVEGLRPAPAGVERAPDARREPEAGLSDRGGGGLPAADTVGQAAEKVRDFVQIVRRDLEFSIDEETGRTIVRVRDADSGKLIRQIPPEEILSIAESLDTASGLLFRGRA